MNVTDVNKLKGCLATDCRSRGGRLGRRERDIVRGHIREWAEAEERVAEQRRGVRAYGHPPYILSKDRALEGNGTLTHIIIIRLDGSE